MSKAVVERWFRAFNSSSGPTPEELTKLVTPDIRFVERPNLMNPIGSDRDWNAMLAGIAAGRDLLAVQHYRIEGHIESTDTVVTRFQWSGTLAADAGAWPAGTQLHAWCTAHYSFHEGRICHIEQYDCYDQPVTPT